MSSLVLNQINEIDKQKSIVGYVLPVGNGNHTRVCTRFICKLFHVSSKRLVRITKHQRFNFNALPDDKRGTNANSHKETYDKDEIRKHILSFPRYYYLIYKYKYT